MNNKKYYWLKFKEDFFAQPQIKKLRRIAGGDTYIIIYQKMMLLSIKNNGCIEYQGIEETLAEELALILDEDLENVKIVLSFLTSTKMLEVIENNNIILPNVLTLIGSETSSAERVRKHRERLKALPCNTEVTKCNTEIEIEKRDRDKIKEIDKRDRYTATKVADSDCLLIIDYFNQVNKTTNRGSKEVVAGLSNILKTYTVEDVKFVIEYMKTGVTYEWQRNNGYNTLSALSKATKFYEKLEKARTSKSNPLSSLENKVYEGDF